VSAAGLQDMQIAKMLKPGTPPRSKIAGARKERRCWGLRADRRERERERERRET